MPELRYPSVFILAPPFLSHFRPLTALGMALKELGTRVTVGCSTDFREDTERAGLQFREVLINRNKNRGVAVETKQDDDESKRLNEFLDATRRGPVETLITQGRHRTADMFANPEELIESIKSIHDEEAPSLWIVDQLTYGATLAMHGLGLTFITFCAPHPLSIPSGDLVYSVPPVWPGPVEPNPEDLQRLVEAAREVDREFTSRFNTILKTHFSLPGVTSAFGLTSPNAVVYNYPPFPGLDTSGTRRIFAGHTYQDQELPDSWKDRLSGEKPLILIALGTFLSSRDDVLNELVAILRSLRPDARIVVGAGASADSIQQRFGESVIADRFIPQRALLPHVEVVFHHGGVSSFTESLYAAKPMIVMPFSSDQFNVAKDVERQRLGAVLDPNHLTAERVAAALEVASGPDVQEAVERWSSVVKSRGPAYAARDIQYPGDDHGSR